MASVYILYSPKVGKYYIGSTKELITRLTYHKTKEFKGSFTSMSDDWELLLTIDGISYATARKIENHIKRMKSKIYIKNLKELPEISERLIKKYS